MFKKFFLVRYSLAGRGLKGSIVLYHRGNCVNGFIV